MTEDEARKVVHPHMDHLWKRPHDPMYCCASVHNGGGSVTFRQCSRTPKVWHGSLGYCTQHDPVKVLEGRQARDREWASSQAMKKAEAQRADDLRRFREACADAVRKIAEGHNDPRALCQELLAEAPTSAGEE